MLPLHDVKEVAELCLVSIRIPGRSCLHDRSSQGAIPLGDCVLVRTVICHGQHAFSSIHLDKRVQIYPLSNKVKEEKGVEKSSFGVNLFLCNFDIY